MKKEEKSLEEIVDEVITKNPKALLEIQAGIRSSLDRLIAEVIRKAKVKVEPRKVRNLILKKL